MRAVTQDDLQFADALRQALTQAAVGDALATQVPADQHLELIVQTATRAISAPVGVLFLVDRPNRSLTFEVVVGRGMTDAQRTPLPLDRGVAGMVALSGQPVALADARQDAQHARDLADQMGYLPQTILAVPVTAPDGTVLGVLELFDGQRSPTFGLEDMTLVGMFAQHVAHALELRRTRGTGAALIGRVLAVSGLPPEMQERLAAQAEQFGTHVEADQDCRRRLALAEQIAAIAAGGEAEYRLCESVLAALAAYVRDSGNRP
ncbi:MAG: hypothetical protein QOF33_1500 [Thermomicrobiales bacterium]|nr:hypothetical protein [Thermomicrobiales bacterium]